MRHAILVATIAIGAARGADAKPHKKAAAAAVAPTPPTPTTIDAARVDWARGLVIAGGVGVADRHAPSPAVARGTARRGAEDAARAAIAAQLPTLPLAGASGGTLADRLGDAAIKARVDRAVADAITIDAEPETDGAWHVVLAVPIEAIRVALAGERAWPATGDVGPAVIVVDGAAGAVPAIGWTITSGTTTLAAPIVWTKTPPTAPHVKATSAKAGTIALADAAGATAATLFVIATK